MKTLFQSPKEEWTDFEKKCFDAVNEIAERFGGNEYARHGAYAAFVWLSSQSEIQYRESPCKTGKRHLNRKPKER